MTTTTANAAIPSSQKHSSARKVVGTTLAIIGAVGAVLGVYMLYKSMTASACEFDSRYPAWAAKAMCDGRNGG